MKGISVTVVDHVRDTTETVEVPLGEYLLLCTEPCHLSHTQVYTKLGTHVLTIKGRLATAMRSALIRVEKTVDLTEGQYCAKCMESEHGDPRHEDWCPVGAALAPNAGKALLERLEKAERQAEEWRLRYDRALARADKAERFALPRLPVDREADARGDKMMSELPPIKSVKLKDVITERDAALDRAEKAEAALGEVDQWIRSNTRVRELALEEAAKVAIGYQPLGHPDDCRCDDICEQCTDTTVAIRALGDR